MEEEINLIRLAENIDEDWKRTNQNLQVDHMDDHHHLKGQTLNLQSTHWEVL